MVAVLYRILLEFSCSGDRTGTGTVKIIKIPVPVLSILKYSKNQNFNELIIR